MTTELEKQFFDTFGIEESLQKLQFITDDRVMRMKTVHGYPKITDYKLLQLLALCQNKSYEEFKSESLKKIIMILGNNPYHKHQVQAIFEGER